MQQLQTTVLNTIQPGIDPIFIISPDRNDGDALAMLVSKHVRPLKSNDNTQSKNFFFSKAYDLTPAKLKEHRANLDLNINEGLNNGKILGQQFSYREFFELEINTIFKKALFLFVYGSDQKNKIDPTDYSDRIIAFSSSHPDAAVIIRVNDVITLPELIVSLLPVESKSAFVKTPSQDAPVSIEAIKTLLSRQEQTKLNVFNSLLVRNLWFKGDDIQFVFIINSLNQENTLNKKLAALLSTFSTTPAVNIIVRNQDLMSKLGVTALSTPSLTVTLASGNLAQDINTAISKVNASEIIIDYLQYTFSVADTLIPFKRNDAPAFIMAAPDENNITENPDRLKLVDILVFGILPNNMTFSRTIWESTNRFDSTLRDDLVLWDFAIKALKAETRYAMLCSAALNAGDVDPNMLQPALTEEKYLEIIERHRGLYDTNLDHILKLVADNQQVPQNVINNLSLKISSITGLLNHSKDELRSLNDYSASLQSRIRTLESSRLYRWSERIHHYKKIFFKEKKPGTSRLKSILKFILFIFSRAGFGLLRIFIARILLKFYSVFEKRPYKIIYSEITKPSSNTSTSEQHFLTYHDWMVANSDYSKLKKEFDEFIVSAKIRPKISIIMPVYDPAVDFLKEAIESVKNQLYSNWELCIADDCSPNPQIRRLLNAYSLKDPRIKINFRTENGHISAASNSALGLVTGDYVMLMDHDDVITQNAVSEFVRHINNHPDDQLIYSDEDKIQNGTYFDPFFKPDYSPDKLISTNYISHLTVIRKDLMDKVKGFTLGLEGSQDFDLMLRCTEFTNRVGHIPKVLYHWRVHELSVASGSEAKPYAYIAAKKAIEAALVRRNTPGEVQYQLGRGYYRTKYKIKAFEKVSIIIPTKDAARLTKNTIDSILALTDYPNYEIIVLDNNSNTQEFFDLMASYKASHPDKFRCIEAKFPFNFSKLINLGVASSDGEFVLMLNNDVEIIQNDWLTYMVSYSQHSRVGAVGVKLLFPDDKIQHAGVVIGLGDIRIAGHLFVNYYKDDHGYFNYIQTTSNYSAVTGACLMCRRSVYEEVGGMDENLEVEYNDIDFCLKIQEKGYNNVYLADVTLYHYESATREHPRENKVAYTRHLKEVEYFRSRWSKYIEHDPYFNPNLSLDYGDCRYELR